MFFFLTSKKKGCIIYIVRKEKKGKERKKMDKKELQKKMVEFYSEQAFTHNYCFGFKWHGVVYAALVKNVNAKILMKLSKLEKASSKNGGGYALKYKINAELWDMVQTFADTVKVVCSVDYLEELNKNSKKNRGYIFEELTANLFNAVLDEKPNTSFRDGGDFYIDGVPYQAKYMNATYTNEATMQRMMAR